MTSIPIYDATAPIACTIGQRRGRRARRAVERIRTYIARLEHTDHGLLLHVPEPARHRRRHQALRRRREAVLRLLGLRDEREGGRTLRWDGPPDVDDFFPRQLVAFFEGDEPLTAIRGLL